MANFDCDNPSILIKVWGIRETSAWVISAPRTNPWPQIFDLYLAPLISQTYWRFFLGGGEGIQVITVRVL